MKKYILVFILLFLVSGCVFNNKKNNLIFVLENDGYDCVNDYCEKMFYENACKFIYGVNFNTKKYIKEMECDSGSIQIYYNWKIGNIEHYTKYLNSYDEEEIVYGNIDDNGDFNCSIVDDDECSQIKTNSIQVKNEFLDYISLADIELEDIK